MNKKIYIFCFLFFILCFLFYIGQGIYLCKNISGTEQVFLIKKGDSVKEVANNLDNQEFIKDKNFFFLYVFLKGDLKEIKAGEYIISSSQSTLEIADKFIKGDVIKEKITIIEGWDIRDIAWYFENKGMFQAEEIFEIIGFPLADYSKTKDLPLPMDFSEEFSFLKDKPKNLGLEGYLFPDTYEIGKQGLIDNDKFIEEIIKKILRNFDEKIDSNLREEIVKQNKSIFEIITMASLLEKEVRNIDDKKIVSGILWKRLDNKVALQVDATITYITGKKESNGFKEDVKIDSPYNTYKYRGLPLGPISNPGLDSILASLYPEDSDFWYYLSTPEGETIFSKTLEEHNIARVKYLFK
jgi:UPF0755 protein